MQVANLKNSIQALAKEKDLDVDVIMDAIEQALVTASRKNLSMYHNAVPSIDKENGKLCLKVTQTVVEFVRNKRLEISLKAAKKIDKKVKVGDEIEVEIDPSVLGRIAAEAAKQVVIQRLRDAERDKVFDEFKDRDGTIVTGIIQRFERRDAILNIGKGEAVLPRNEQPGNVRYQMGDRLKCLILCVDKDQKGPQVVLSRNSPDLILRLFEQEVPEVADGTVKINAIARHAGVRTKLAVSSTNPDVDPVGACVGMKGSRVQMIVDEFEGEKIDIIPYSTNTIQFLSDALKPAKILSIDLDEAEKRAKIVVPEDNLALAIGQKGQNVQLASKLVEWKIDIKGSDAAKEEHAHDEIDKRYLEDLLSQIPDLTEDLRSLIINSAEFNSVAKIAKAHQIEIDALLGGNTDLATQIIEYAREYNEELEKMQDETDTEEISETSESSAQAEENSTGESTAEAEESIETETAEEPASDESFADAVEVNEETEAAENEVEAAPETNGDEEK